MSKNKAIKFGSKGWYKLQVLDKNGLVKDEKTVNNVVTYEGAYIAFFGNTSGTSSYSGFNSPLYAALGTGTQELTRNSEALGNKVGAFSNMRTTDSTRSTSEVDNGDGTATFTSVNVMAFSLGDLVGTFSEVGVYSATSSSGVLIAGQLIKDEFGNPTTVTVLADEQVVITYTLEYTYPNTSSLVGTGVVTDASSNSYNYEIWAQPYFAAYNTGGNNYIHRYFSASNADEWFFRDASGTDSYGISIDTGQGWQSNITLGVDGLVTATTAPYTFSPSAFQATDIVFVGAYTNNANNTSNTVFNGSTAPLVGSGSDSATSCFVIKFLNPITKTGSQSLSLEVELQIQL